VAPLRSTLEQEFARAVEDEEEQIETMEAAS